MMEAQSWDYGLPNFYLICYAFSENTGFLLWMKIQHHWYMDHLLQATRASNICEVSDCF